MLLFETARNAALLEVDAFLEQSPRDVLSVIKSFLETCTRAGHDGTAIGCHADKCDGVWCESCVLECITCSCLCGEIRCGICLDGDEEECSSCHAIVTKDGGSPECDRCLLECGCGVNILGRSRICHACWARGRKCEDCEFYIQNLERCRDALPPWHFDVCLDDVFDPLTTSVVSSPNHSPLAETSGLFSSLKIDFW